MSNTKKLYAGWVLEKNRLINIVVAAAREGGEVAIHDAVDRWFRDSVFELAVSSVRDRYYVESLKHEGHESQFREDEFRQMTARIGVKIGETEGMFRDITEGMGGFEQRRVTVFVLGRPRFSKDNETGNLRYLRDHIF